MKKTDTINVSLESDQCFFLSKPCMAAKVDPVFCVECKKNGLGTDGSAVAKFIASLHHRLERLEGK